MEHENRSDRNQQIPIVIPMPVPNIDHSGRSNQQIPMSYQSMMGEPRMNGNDVEMANSVAMMVAGQSHEEMPGMHGNGAEQNPGSQEGMQMPMGMSMANVGPNYNESPEAMGMCLSIVDVSRYRENCPGSMHEHQGAPMMRNGNEINSTVAMVNTVGEENQACLHHAHSQAGPFARAVSSTHLSQHTCTVRAQMPLQNCEGMGNMSAADVSRHAAMAGQCVFGVPVQYNQPECHPSWKEGILEDKLNEILFCVVCLELPNTAIYQCKMGHIMCEPCLLRLFADARLRHETARCPGCRINISFDLVSRNLAVEAISSELPSKCKYCAKKFPSKFLEFHMKRDCLARPAVCKYTQIGCNWSGVFGEQGSHEDNCLFGSLTGREIIQHIQGIDHKLQEENATFYNLFNLLDSQRMVFTDIKLLLCIDDNDGTPYFETPLFSAFNVNWVIRAVPDLASERPISYQLVLKSSIARAMPVKYLALKGPFLQFSLKPIIYDYTFGNDCPESPLNELPVCFEEGIRLLARSFSFHLRLLMFV